MKIYKYAVPTTGEVLMPQGARVLSVGVQDEDLMVWAEVDSSAPARIRRLQVVGTGFDAPERGRFIGTVLVYDGRIVLHVYDDPVAD